MLSSALYLPPSPRWVCVRACVHAQPFPLCVLNVCQSDRARRAAAATCRRILRVRAAAAAAVPQGGTTLSDCTEKHDQHAATHLCRCHQMHGPFLICATVDVVVVMSCIYIQIRSVDL
jgi:hypothetical protein